MDTIWNYSAYNGPKILRKNTRGIENQWKNQNRQDWSLIEKIQKCPINSSERPPT